MGLTAAVALASMGSAFVYAATGGVSSGNVLMSLLMIVCMREYVFQVI